MRRQSFKEADVKRRASLDSSVAGVLVQGYLQKQSTGVRKRWQERFYALEGDFLKYYKNEASYGAKALKGALDITALQGVTLDPMTHELTLKLSVADVEHGGTRIESCILRATSAGDGDRWWAKLQEVAKRNTAGSDEPVLQGKAAALARARERRAAREKAEAAGPPAPAPAPAPAPPPAPAPINLEVTIDGVLRRYSAPSATALTTLLALKDRMDELEGELAKIDNAHGSSDGGGLAHLPSLEVGQMADRVAKIGGLINAIEPKVDGVHTGSLNTGKDAARTLRKALVRRGETADSSIKRVWKALNAERKRIAALEAVPGYLPPAAATVGGAVATQQAPGLVGEKEAEEKEEECAGEAAAVQQPQQRGVGGEDGAEASASLAIAARTAEIAAAANASTAAAATKAAADKEATAEASEVAVTAAAPPPAAAVDDNVLSTMEHGSMHEEMERGRLCVAVRLEGFPNVRTSFIARAVAACSH